MSGDVTWTPAALAARIQHTLIRTDATRDEVLAHCRECLEHGFQAAMVAGNWVPVAREVLAGSGVLVASAVDFPLGIMSTAGKVAEARALVDAGAVELDIMVNVGWLRSGMTREFRDDIAAVVEAAAPAAVKVMLELPLLTPAERDIAVDLSVEAGVAYVKNASSSAVGIASPEEMRYLRSRVPASVRVKASGGIKAYDQAVALLEAGADLVGSSAGVAIIGGGSAAESY
jgi:deoxyribose-phosphate aldolase